MENDVQKKDTQKEGANIDKPKEEEKEINIIAENVALMESERLMAKRKEIFDMETAVDKKLNEIKRFLENTELGGRAFANQNKPKPETPQEYAKRIMAGGR